MKAHRLLIATALATSVFVGSAEAGQVVWLDFANFNLNAFGTVNGNSPPRYTLSPPANVSIGADRAIRPSAQPRKLPTKVSSIVERCLIT